MRKPVIIIHIMGTVTAISDTSISVKRTDGKTQTAMLASIHPHRQLEESRYDLSSPLPCPREHPSL